MTITCFNCGEAGHVQRECPAMLRAVRTGRRQPPPAPVTVPRNPELARAWAAAIREALGWAQPGSENE